MISTAEIENVIETFCYDEKCIRNLDTNEDLTAEIVISFRIYTAEILAAGEFIHLIILELRSFL